MKVQNFSASKFFGDKSDENIIPIGMQNADIMSDPVVLENLNYFAPEFIEYGQESPAMDFWSFGCIIYFMLTGKKPFEANSPQNTIVKILNNDYSFDDHLNISEDAQDLIYKLL